MHSQKKSEIRRDLTETRCALATPTCLQHPERLAEARSAMISSAPPLESHHHDQCGQYRAHDHENADDLPSLFFMTRHCCRPPRASHQPQQGRDAENGKGGKPAHHGEHLFVPTRHRAPPRVPAAQSARQAFFTANRVVDGTGALRPKFDQDSDTEQNSDRDVFWPLSR